MIKSCPEGSLCPIKQNYLHMKTTFLTLVSVLLVTFYSFAGKRTDNLPALINHAVDIALIQSKNMCTVLKDSTDRLPRTTDKKGKLLTSNSNWWCSGFFPGVLWYLYEATGNKQIENQAEVFTERIEREKLTTNNHDVGFMIFCSFGNGYRLTKKTAYLNVIQTACQSLSTRYSDKMGLIRSWDFNTQIWQYPVIIDNMMNLEMLLFGGREFGNKRFTQIALNHANKTMENHFRPDFSCYHLVSYDTITGKPNIKQTHQGAFDSSSWARGQGWALYGYTMMYRETKNPIYLLQARNIAQFILHNPHLPKDKIPYWDFDAPNIPNEERDASAGALIASALLELSGYVAKAEKQEYLSVAETQLRTLCSDEYLAKPGTNGNFILKHSVGNKPQIDIAPYYGEVDVPLTYADYYFMEAIVRYKALNNKVSVFNKQGS